MDEPMILLRGNSHPDLANAITRHLEIRLGDSSVYREAKTDRVEENYTHLSLLCTKRVYKYTVLSGMPTDKIC